MKGPNLKIACKFVLLSICLSSCGNKNKEVTVEEPGLPVFEFNQNDSANIQSLADSYLASVNSGDFESAADMLNTVSNGVVSPLTDQERNGYLSAMKSLPQHGFVQQDLLLFSDRDNELRIAVKMTEDAKPETGEGVIMFVLNPIEVDGQWYLTLRSEYAEGVGLYH